MCAPWWFATLLVAWTCTLLFVSIPRTEHEMTLGDGEGRQLGTRFLAEANATLGQDSATEATTVTNVTKMDDQNGTCGGCDYSCHEKNVDAEFWKLLCEVTVPQQQQPFYFMPFSMTCRVAITFTVFGFDVAFKRPVNPEEAQCPLWEKFKATGKTLAAPVAMFGFLGMSLNTYYQDFTALRDAGATGWMDKFCTMLSVWVLSPNYVAASSVWSSFSIQSPKRLLGLDPNYLADPFLGFPLCGTAKWLSPIKQVYALVLLPYFIPKYIFLILSAFSGFYWLFCDKCICVCTYLKHTCCCPWIFLGVVISLGFWHAAKSAFADEWEVMGPLYYYALMQYWGTYIVPHVSAFFFGLINGISCTKTWEAIYTGIGSAMGSLAGASAAMALSNNDAQGIKDAQKMMSSAAWLTSSEKKLLMELNQSKLVDDFNLDGYEILQDTGDDTEILGKVKIMIFIDTLKSMSAIMVEQMVVVSQLRMLKSYNFQGFMLAIKTTVSERSIVAYISNLASLGMQTRSKGLDMIWRILG